MKPAEIQADGSQPCLQAVTLVPQPCCEIPALNRPLLLLWEQTSHPDAPQGLEPQHHSERDGMGNQTGWDTLFPFS